MNIININSKVRSIYTVEDQIKEYKSLSNSIKMLETQREKLKREMISQYFLVNDVYQNKHGLVMATYKKSIRISFNQSSFKENHEKLYNDFLDAKEVSTFIVK